MYKGPYNQYTASGLKYIYQTGDVILFEGNLYKAQKETNFSPFQDSLAWSYTGKSQIFFGDQPPINPQEGQQWERNGILYTYFFDGDNYSWVQF